MSANVATVKKLSEWKVLPEDFLVKDVGLADVPGKGVRIPYFGCDGMVLRNKFRTAERARAGSYWDEGKSMHAYGEWRLAGKHKHGRVILVEGESDCWALWYHGWTALGIPGSGCTGVLNAEHAAYFDEVYVHREPDDGGKEFVKGVARRLAELKYTRRAWVFTLAPEHKDPAELRARRGSEFDRWLEPAMAEAKLLELPSIADADSIRRVADAAGVGTAGVGESRDEETARVVSLGDLTPQPVEWLWPGRIPAGTITILDGDPNMGKSTLTLDLAARLSCGLPMPCAAEAPPKPRSVVLLSAEDDMANTVGPRLRAAGADMNRIKAYTHTVNHRLGDDLPSFPKDLPRLEKLIEDEEAALVILDPLMAFFDGATDAHRDNVMRRFLYRLADVASRTRSAMLAVRHLNKTGGMQAMYRGGGSIGIIGAARSGLMVGRDPRALHAVDTFLLAVTKSNLAERAPSIRYRVRDQDGVSGIEWLGHVAADVDEMVGRPLMPHVLAVDNAVYFLKRALAGGPQPAAELQRKAESNRLAWPTVRRARLILGVVATRPDRVGDTWTWQLPDKPVIAGD